MNDIGLVAFVAFTIAMIVIAVPSVTAMIQLIVDVTKGLRKQ